jgi:hypothetical protein
MTPESGFEMASMGDCRNWQTVLPKNSSLMKKILCFSVGADPCVRPILGAPLQGRSYDYFHAPQVA